MVDEFHICTWNITIKPVAIALSGAGKGLRRRDSGGDHQRIIEAYSELSQ
jgi:hypothetical protein